MALDTTVNGNALSPEDQARRVQLIRERNRQLALAMRRLGRIERQRLAALRQLAHAQAALRDAVLPAQARMVGV